MTNEELEQRVENLESVVEALRQIIRQCYADTIAASYMVQLVLHLIPEEAAVDDALAMIAEDARSAGMPAVADIIEGVRASVAQGWQGAVKH